MQSSLTEMLSLILERDLSSNDNSTTLTKCSNKTGPKQTQLKKHQVKERLVTKHRMQYFLLAKNKLKIWTV